MSTLNNGELQQHLKDSHHAFVDRLQNLSNADFMHQHNNKWTAGQQLQHIIKSVSPVNKAFALPGFMMKMYFGKANRPSRSYEQLVEKYQGKLAEGGKSTSRFLPVAVTLAQRKVLIKQLEKLVRSLAWRIGGFSEKQLDELILPHPLLGKLTLREMLYFTIYHVGHHDKQVSENLKR